jgi:aspartyl-tRNA(Asn)/glutamyl-tRNA(Gln) amidotransferase subunit C
MVDAGDVEGHAFAPRAALHRLPATPVIASKTVDFQPIGQPMSVDKDTVRRIAKLSRIALDEARVTSMVDELNGIFAWVQQLNEVNIDGVPAMTSVVAQRLKMRDDTITDGGIANELMANAPQGEDHFFVVPKVVE